MGVALQIIGLALIAIGCFLVAPWLGFIAAGIAATIVGAFLEIR